MAVKNLEKKVENLFENELVEENLILKERVIKLEKNEVFYENKISENDQEIIRLKERINVLEAIPKYFFVPGPRLTLDSLIGNKRNASPNGADEN